MDIEPQSLIKSFGYLGVWTIIFAETGILFGVLLPGDSLLVAAGILCAHGHFNIALMTTGCFIAALIGNLFGYALGQKWGKPFLEKYGPELTTPEKIAKTYDILKKYENTGVIISRFLPIARTLAPFLGGVIRMKYRAFFSYSVLGALIWGGGLPLVGYYLGEVLPKGFLDLMLIPMLFFLLVAVLLPYLQKRFRKNG